MPTFAKEHVLPNKSYQHQKYIKQYLNVTTIASNASDELLDVKRNEPFMPCEELIIVPRS